MSKKSARSKGYRKTYQKVTGYTEKEKKILTIGFLAIVVVLVAFLTVPNLIEAATLLKLDKDGVVAVGGDNWIIANVSSYSDPKYRKLGESNPIEGFELSEISDNGMDDNIRVYTYTPTGEAAAQKYTVQPGRGDAASLVERYRSIVTGYADVSYMDEEVHVETINGIKTYSFVLEYTMESFELTEEDMGAEEGTLADFLLNDPESATDDSETTTDSSDASSEAAEDEAAEEVVLSYTQCVALYAETNVDETCILILVTNEGDDASVYGDRTALHELALQAVNGLTIE